MIELQIKPNRWSCSVTALAMTLKTPVKKLIAELGHDGSQIIFPQLPEPLCRRGFHSQELIHLAWNHGFSLTPFELFPRIQPASGNYDPVAVQFTDNWQRFQLILHREMGILEGKGRRCRHAVHFNRGIIFDPDGRQYKYSQKACEEQGFYTDRALVATPRRTYG